MSLGGALSLSGSVLGVTVNSTSVFSSPSCTPQVSLYQLDSHGNKQTPALSTTALNSDGSFVFESLDGIYDTSFQDLHYLLEADPCDASGATLARFVSGLTAQDISYGSTLLSYIPDVKQVATNNLSQVPVVSADQVQSLLNQLSTTDIAGSYQAGLNNSQTVTNFQNTFGFPFSELQYSLPTIASVVHVDSVNELQAAAMSVSATHWDPNISVAYLWKINGVVKSTGPNLNWTPGKNAQGADTVDLYVGIDTTGDGTLNVSKSFSHLTYSLLVNNTYPPVPPILSLSSTGVTNSLTASLSLTTGASLTNCQSFSKLVFTESNTSAALAQPSSGDFDASSFTCTTAGTQSANFLMSMYDGNHTIALWGEDASGNITLISNASFVNVTVDQTPPVVSPLTLSSLLLGGSTVSVPFSASDATSGVASLALSFSSDGGATFTSVADLTSATSPYSWAVPLSDTANGVLRLVATDHAGNTTTVNSNTFSVDSTAPAALVLAFTTPGDFGATAGGLALSKQAANSVTVSGCSGDAVKMLFKEIDTVEGVSAPTPSSPAATDAGWTTCAATRTWTALTGDGEKTYYAWSMDAAGNISAASNALIFVLDQTSPALSLTSWTTANLAVAAGSTQLITWSASDAHLSSSPVKIESTLDGLTWTTLTLVAANASNSGCTVPAGSSGCFTWSVPTLDGGGNPLETANAQIRVSVTDTPGNPVTSVVGSAFQIRSTGPVLSSTVINDGAQYAGTTLINLKIALSDHGFSTSGIKVLVTQATTPTADCVFPGSPTWLAWTSSSMNVPYQVSVVNGTKKICAWAMNTAGFMSATSTFTCSNGVDCNTIDLEIGNPPTITTFTVSSSGGNSAPAGSNIAISWAAQAQGTLGLDNNPIEIAYTTDNVNWLDIVSGQNINNAGAMTWQGSLSGNPITGSGSFNFTSPTSGFTRLRAVARDTAGNLSIVAYSSVFNTTTATGGSWQIYAGTTDRGIGGSGTSASLYDNGGEQSIVMDPTTGNLYARDDNGNPNAWRELNVLTGKVSTFIQNGTFNLSTNGGALPAQINAPISANSRMVFGKDGMLYFHASAVSSPIYKIDLIHNTSTIYAGGGMSYSSDANALNIFVQATTPLAMDEDNSLYFWTDCNPSSPSASTNPFRLMKVAQNPDGSAGAATAILGNCSYGASSPSGTDALSASIGPTNSLNNTYVGLGSIVPVNHGQTIYVGLGGSGGGYSSPIKIVNDGTNTRIYTSTNLVAASTQNLSYNSVDGFIYGATATLGIYKFKPVLTANAGGETSTTVASSAGTGANCMNDGTSASQSCVVSDSSPVFDSSGTVYFEDGAYQNTPNGYRVRYIDASDNVQTIMGTLPFYGNGMQKELVRGSIGGIFYKSTSSSPQNATAFPNGLYLSSPNMVFGYINPSTGIYSTILGNQHNATIDAHALDGLTASSTVTMGSSYQGGSGRPLIFDSNGHPWLRVQNQVVTLDDNLTITALNNNTGIPWSYVSPTTDPHLSSIYVGGGYQNFAVAGNSLFLIGAYKYTGFYADPTPQIRMLDYTNNAQPIILGGSYTASQNMTTPSSVSVGDGTTTPVASSALNSGCVNTAACEMVYDSVSDTLYFSDQSTQLHYIVHPTTPKTSSLGTIAVNSTGGGVTNFIFRPDGSQIFYVTGGSAIYCYPVTAAGIKTWCPSSGIAPNLYGFGAQIGALTVTTNMFTWMDSGNLLLSTGTQILQFTLPTGP